MFVRAIKRIEALSSKFPFTFFFTCLAIVAFTLIGYKNLDPDFGWHYKMGEIIVTTGIPKTDPFTYSMPSYPFVDYEWGSNIFIYEIYSRFGKLFLAFLYALFAVFSVHVAVPSKYKKYAFLPLLLSWSVMVPRAGIRPQVAGWFLLGVLIHFLFDKRVWNKWRFFFPLFMLFWANFHGSYPFAFILVGAFVFFEILKERKIDWKNIGIILLAGVATLINPYGYNNWMEVVKHISKSGFFRKTISEWQPFYSFVDLGLLFMLVLSTLFIWKYKSKIHWGFIALYFITGFMALSTIRHAPIFIITVTPIICMCFYLLEREVSPILFGPSRFAWLWKLQCTIAAVIFISSFILWSNDSYTENTKYPREAVNFIRENNLEGRIFNQYGWGGYLIWKLPEHKVFMDGRMPGFSWKAPVGESDDAFKEYLKVTSGEDDWENVFHKFDVKYVLWYADEKTDDWEISRIVTNWLVTYGLESTPGVSLTDRLRALGWKERYKDDVAIILESPE